MDVEEELAQILREEILRELGMTQEEIDRPIIERIVELAKENMPS